MDKRIGTWIAAVIMLAIVVVAIIIKTTGQDPAAQTTPATTASVHSETPSVAPTETSNQEASSPKPAPTAPEAADDYAGVMTDLDEEAAQLVTEAATKLATWEYGETRSDRQQRLTGLLDPELVQESPWTERLGPVEGAKVAAQSFVGASASGMASNADPKRTMMSVPVVYETTIPHGTGGAAIAKSSATWQFVVDLSGDAPKITEVTEPTTL
ncbi:hypothetical protein JRG19_09920 [Pseudoclavibacter alba]|uniref:hypothetical protein n=1 Tax=Pseudoclavibacter albus TaxID=272241 RepID=UPI0019D2D4AF|nr:hypothetical protein [Pseudoclavibacter alba]MBN6778845.1 hypothetical protein [Pseudoclavibacter alba]